MRLVNGNTLIATGNGHSVLEVTPEKEIIWQINQNDLPGITLAWVTTLPLAALLGFAAWRLIGTGARD